jgi:hypothetical protein
MIVACVLHKFPRIPMVVSRPSSAKNYINGLSGG